MMNTRHKSLTMAFLAVFIIGMCIKVGFVGARDADEDAASTRHPADFLQSKYLRITRLTAKDGLSTDRTVQVFQDKRGFM